MRDVQLFLDTFYKKSSTYKVGLNQLKNMYQHYCGEYYTDKEFSQIMEALGYKIKDNCYKLRENKKEIWHSGKLFEN